MERRPLSGDYWLLWSGSALSNFGDGIRLTAMPLLAATLTRDPLAVSAVLAATTVPWLVLGPVGGSVVDRVDRRLLMTIGQAARGLVVAGLAVAVATDTVTMIHLYVTALVIGVGEVIVDTSSQAAIPMLSRGVDLERANSRLIAAEFVLNDLAGGPVGAFLFAFAAALPFGVDAATFLAGALLVSIIRTPMQEVRQPGPGMWAATVEGFRFFIRHDLLRGLIMAVAVVNLSLGSGASLLVLLALEELGLDAAGYGLLIGLGAVGGVIGALFASRIAARVGRRNAMAGGTALLGLGHLGLAVAGDGTAAVVALVGGTLGATVFTVVGRSLRQQVTPDRLLGRVVASSRLIGMGAVPLGAILGGVLARLAGLRLPYAIGAGLILLGGFMTYRVATPQRLAEA